jgi:hypothetical protein
MEKNPTLPIWAVGWIFIVKPIVVGFCPTDLALGNSD